MAKRAISQAQIASHRLMNRSISTDDPLHSLCVSPQIQSRGVKERCACFSTAPSWGVKLSRTAFSGAPGLSGCPLHPRPKWWLVPPRALSGSESCCGRRDWASLGDDGPAGLIAEFVLANDVADYVRFRAVCLPWRRCSVDPRSQGGLDGRFHPRQWIMLDKAHAASRRHRFLNVSTGECIRIDLPELEEHTLLAVTPEGLLLLIHEPTLVVRLLNPLTRQLTDLPPLTALLTEHQRARRSEGELGKSLTVSGVGLADAFFTVAVYFRFPTVLAVAKPGDERWTPVSNRYMDSALPFAGRFYCAIGSASGSSIMVLSNLGSAQQQSQPQLVTAVERRRSLRFCRMSDTLHLVDNAGEMLMVHRATRLDKGTKDERHKVEYVVYRVDLEAGDLVQVKSLNRRAVLMGRCRAISVPAARAFSSSLAADTLYPGSDCFERTRMNRIEGYNVADGSSQPCYHDSCIEMVQPYSAVDCFAHSIQSSGKHLA